MHVRDLLTFGKDSFNVKHQINEISFGAHFLGIMNPLDGYTHTSFFSICVVHVVLMQLQIAINKEDKRMAKTLV
jgi:hypothetical protein